MRAAAAAAGEQIVDACRLHVEGALVKIYNQIRQFIHRNHQDVFARRRIAPVNLFPDYCIAREGFLLAAKLHVCDGMLHSGSRETSFI